LDALSDNFGLKLHSMAEIVTLWKIPCINSSLNETILWQSRGFFGYFVYYVWSPFFEGNDAISAIKLMDSTGKGLPNSCMLVI
jgi:hypothetical protein